MEKQLFLWASMARLGSKGLRIETCDYPALCSARGN